MRVRGQEDWQGEWRIGHQGQLEAKEANERRREEPDSGEVDQNIQFLRGALKWVAGWFLVACRHRPSSFHPPDREGIAQPLMGQVVTACQFGIHLITLENLVEEINIARCQFEDLDLAELV